MINIVIRGIKQSHAKFNRLAMKAMLVALSILSYVIPMPHHQAFAFWTYNKPGDEPQHWLITSLVRWPKNDPLFDNHWRKMGEWSEFPDRGKDPIVGHGIALFDKMDEKGRARLSFSKAVEHYSHYLRNPQNTGEREIAAQCLAHAYHYFADVGDFSQGDHNARVSVSSVLKTLHNYHGKEPDQYNRLIETRRQAVNPDIDSIIRILELTRTQKNNPITHNLLQIVACLEQVNVCFLAQVRGNNEGIFGSSNYIQNSLKGDIYELPVNTSSLPNFSDPKLRHIGTIYTKGLNIPERKFDQGFPGVSNRIEWFAIRYAGRFYVSQPGHYGFRLHSDDGSRLFIDGRLTVNNDGTHPPRSVSGSAMLNEGLHHIVVEYFQGPRFHIALQLFIKPLNGTETIFRMP